uniref:Uncharacterized protein n=1 Tax=Hyaloperonospora arabidopsidis (strain Emoy2) TaxID=559515 RepID=M4BCD1_HYAAE
MPKCSFCQQIVQNVMQRLALHRVAHDQRLFNANRKPECARYAKHTGRNTTYEPMAFI